MTFEKVPSEREIEIYFSKGIFFAEEKRHKEALKIYQEADRRLKNLLYLKDTTIRSRISFNLAKSLTNLEQYEKSINTCHFPIKECLQNDDFYLLGDLNYQIGFNYELQKECQKAIILYEKAFFIFTMQGSPFIQIVTDKIKNL
ncbi:tetratricopeptide repeat protein [Cytobacillus horneckiae]|uniref:tetratricopeptide repeat protein n=1 Tax=Cytobacillus horneckiae TaxID=549687 RepID=UPI0019D1CB1F|nr:tetratricopeptide repeat protein [Cytobacillus horneckiae]